ncbi:MAG: hypothetical protein IJW44_04450 [Clostridia bacterium]|nr:hypothetical protein [Clostridia bacterium]
MAKREVFTLKEVERDIVYSMKHAPEMSESSYKRMLVPCAILGGILGVFSVFQPKIGLIVLLVFVLAFILSCVLGGLKKRHRIKSVRMEDYQLEVVPLSHKEEEHYRQRRGGARVRRSKQIDNYTLHFENGKSLRLPKDNYCWSRERPMSDHALYQCVYRGSECILVTHKESGRIVMAYPAEYFEYKG